MAKTIQCGFKDENTEQNSPKLTIWERCVPRTIANSEPDTPKCLIMEHIVPFKDGSSEQNDPSYQFGTKLFLSQIGMQNKTSLNL